MINKELENIKKEIELRGRCYRCGQNHDSRVIDHIYFMGVYHQYLIDLRKQKRNELKEIYQNHNKLMGVI